MVDLAKRTAGTPLSEAELEQRRAAAKARWTAVGAGAVAAAGAGVLAHHKIGQTRAAAAADIRAHRSVIDETERLNSRRWQRHALKAGLLAENLKPHEGQAFVDHAIRTSSSQLRRAQAERRSMFAEHGVDRVMGDGSPIRVVPEDVAHRIGLEYAFSKERNLAERVEDLRTNGKGARRVTVDASAAHPVAAHQRPAPGGRIAQWEQGADEMFGHLREQLGLAPASAPASAARQAIGRKGLTNKLADHRAIVQAILLPLENSASEEHYAAADEVRGFLQRHGSLDQVAASLKEVPARQRAGFLASFGLPKMVYRPGPPRTVDVQAVAARVIPAHTLKVGGYPDRPTRNFLSGQLTHDVQRRGDAWKIAEQIRASARVAGARRSARQASLPSLERLALLRHARTRFGLIAGAAGIAAVGAGALGWLGARQLTKVQAKRSEFPAPGDPPRITLLVGMPGSGKSTWRALAMAQGVTRPTTVVSADEHVEAVARQRGVGFSEAFKLVDHKAVERAHGAQIKAAVEAGHDIIVDKINASPKGRARTLGRVPSSYEKHAVHLVVPEHVLATRRALRPGKVIPKHALREMAEKFRPPTVGEFDYVHRAVQHHGVMTPLAKAFDAAKHLRGQRGQFVAAGAVTLAASVAWSALQRRQRQKEIDGDGNGNGRVLTLGSAARHWRTWPDHARDIAIGVTREGGRPTRKQLRRQFARDSLMAREREIVLGRDGTVLQNIRGKAAEVSRTWRQANDLVTAFRGHKVGAFLHNHPLDEPPSAADADSAFTFEDIAAQLGNPKPVHLVYGFERVDDQERGVPLRTLVRVSRFDGGPRALVPEISDEEFRDATDLDFKLWQDVRRAGRSNYRTKAVEKLAKGAPPDSTPASVESTTSPEATLSRRLATLFGQWTDEAEAKILAPSATTMHADMIEGLGHAMQPLDQVVRSGITAPIPVDAGDGGQNLAFSLKARSPAVAAYVDQYRQSRITALADEQKATIKAQLIDAATAGANPQGMANRIKQTIGLTPFQAGHVVNYEEELRGLNPNALNRQLRDRRFDSTIRRAMEDGTELSTDYIDKAVDAYHRRYLAFRATTIANTEAVGAANNGQAAAAASLEDEHPDFEIEKEWIATHDELTRHDHVELNGQVVRGLETPFVCDSGDQIRWPHDPQAPARQVIRCRCGWVTRLVPRVRAAA